MFASLALSRNTDFPVELRTTIAALFPRGGFTPETRPARFICLFGAHETEPSRPTPFGASDEVLLVTKLSGR